MKRVVLSAVLALCLPFAFAAEKTMPHEEGAAAYDAALKSYSCVDYDRAYKMFQTNADKGHALSQYMMGVMLSAGQGAPEDDKVALEWFKRAARQNLSDAHFALGDMYHKGEGTARDDVQALFWFKLAAKGGHNLAREMIESIAAGLPPAQIEQSDRMLRDWPGKTGQ